MDLVGCADSTRFARRTETLCGTWPERRVPAALSNRPLDARDRGFVPGDAGVDLFELGVGGSIPAAVEARNGASFRRDRTAQRADVAVDRRDLSAQAAFLAASRRNPPAHRAHFPSE